MSNGPLVLVLAVMAVSLVLAIILGLTTIRFELHEIGATLKQIAAQREASPHE
jgi:hypothetical protein